MHEFTDFSIFILPLQSRNNINQPTSTMSDPTTTTTLINNVKTHVKTQMNQNDPSHDYAHIQRVLSLTHYILKRERPLHPTHVYNEPLLTLSALLHDLNDRKYSSSFSHSPSQSPYDLLISYGADPSLANQVQLITSHTSYSTEIANPGKITHLLETQGLRELGIVQDADRLDALGAVGVARCFTFLGAKGKKAAGRENGKSTSFGEEGLGLGDAIGHFEGKLEKLPGLMKTETGRELARERVRRVRVFREWFREEEEEEGDGQTDRLTD